jgi:hypothetical protein
MMSFAEIHKAAHERLQRDMADLGPRAPKFAVDEFIATSKTIGPLDTYHVLPERCRDLALAVSGIDKGQWLPAFLRLAIWQAMVEGIEPGQFATLPPRVQHHQLVQFRRLLGYEEAPVGWNSLESDIFLKDFGLASLRLYAAAAQLIDLRSGLPRSLLFRSGLDGLVRGVRMLADCGGFKPMLQIHTHTAYLEEFNEAGWEECYRTCVDIYRARPEIRGMCGGSWFYDPQLSSISPRLAYLVETPCGAGAHLLFTDKTGDFVQDAIATSPSRRKLYDEGKYHPRRYTLVWSRAAQMKWAAGSSRGPDQ